VANAEAAVAAAEAADTAAQNALTAANSDSYITPEEVAALQAASNAATQAKADAQAAVDLVPNGSDKDGFETRLDALNNITVPTATVATGYDQLVANAEAAVAA